MCQLFDLAAERAKRVGCREQSLPREILLDWAARWDAQAEALYDLGEDYASQAARRQAFRCRMKAARFV